jgi:hypothetical protein
MEAETFLCRAFEGREQTLGRDRSLALEAASNVGMFLKDQGKFSLAEPSLRRVLLGDVSRCSGLTTPPH